MSPPSDAPALDLARPDLSERERALVLEVLGSTRLAFGPMLERFERLMAERCGTRHAVGVSSGTAALHCLVRAMAMGTGDEVVTTPYSFVASANALLFEDVTPVFVDIDPVTFNLDPARVEDALSPRTRGVLAVDVFGTPADWPALTEIAERHGLRLIDDACEALGATVEGRPIGGWGDGASFGFYPNKQITTGEGGCITTDDADVADLCRSLRNQGRAARSRMEHVRLGFNYRLDELSAALGCAQLERLDGILERRAALAARYADAFEAAFADAGLALSEHLTLPGAAPVGERSWFVYVVRLADAYAEGARDRLMEDLRADGIGCAPYFPCIHLQPLYRTRFGYRPGAFPVAEAAAARTLALPFHTGLSDADVARVAEGLAKALPTLPRD